MRSKLLWTCYGGGFPNLVDFRWVCPTQFDDMMGIPKCKHQNHPLRGISLRCQLVVDKCRSFFLFQNEFYAVSAACFCKVMMKGRWELTFSGWIEGFLQ